MQYFPLSGRLALRFRVHARDEILAHESWTAFSAETTTLKATVIDNNITGSDRTLQVRAADGYNWTVELADKTRNEEVGLDASSAATGDTVVVIGMCAQHFGENRIKAVQLTIGDQDYALYPELLESA